MLPKVVKQNGAHEYVYRHCRSMVLIHVDVPVARTL